MKTSNTEKIRRMTFMSVLAAIVIIISFIPLRTLGLEITFSMVPVAVGACVLGPAAGAFLGAVFGVVSFLQCLFGYSAFGAVLLGINPIFTLIVCIPTRMLAGWLAGLISKAVMKRSSHNLLACACASILAPVFNTVFFMSTLVAFFYNTDYIKSFVQALNAVNPLHFILLFVGINGLVEIICGFLVALPVSKAAIRVLK